MRSRAETVREIAADIRIRAQVCALKRLAAETTAGFADLVEHGVSLNMLRGFYAVRMLSEQLQEKRRKR